MYWYSEDGLDVGQHCLKLLWITLEAHLCQYHWLIDILEEKNKDKKYLRDEKLFISHAGIQNQIKGGKLVSGFYNVYGLA